MEPVGRHTYPLGSEYKDMGPIGRRERENRVDFCLGEERGRRGRVRMKVCKEEKKRSGYIMGEGR
jgi:hypothetical protein